MPENPDEIPFQRDRLAFKIIMQPRALANTLADFATLAADRLAVEVRARPQPALALYGRGGDCGVTVYDFGGQRGELLESISVIANEEDDEDTEDGFTQTYRFELVKAASEAMRIANKLSLRGDRQGVLNLQFMTHVDGGEANFMEFRVVPDAEDSWDEAEGMGNGDEEMDDG
jgi:cell cycle checkpoint protein